MPMPNQPRVFVQSFASQSHVELAAQFRTSLLDSGFPEEQLILEAIPQDCVSGTYMQSGWLRTMSLKMKMIREFVRHGRTLGGNQVAQAGDIVLHCDADIRWYRNPEEPILQAMEKLAVAAQHDGLGYACAGLIAFRVQDPDALELVRLWQGEFTNGVGTIYRHDQDALQPPFKIIRNAGKASFLPVTFWSAGAVTSEVWEPGKSIPQPPSTIVAHHANWCVGPYHKREFLQQVVAIVNLNSSSK